MLQGQLHNENDEDLDEEDEDEDEDHAMELDSDMVIFFLVSNNLYSYIQKTMQGQLQIRSTACYFVL